MKSPCKETLTSPSRLLTAFPHAILRLLRQEKTPPGLATASELATWISDPNIRLKITLVDSHLSDRYPVKYYLVKKIIDRGEESIGLSETFVVPLDPSRYSEEINLIEQYLTAHSK